MHMISGLVLNIMLQNSPLPGIVRYVPIGEARERSVKKLRPVEPVPDDATECVQYNAN